MPQTPAQVNCLLEIFSVVRNLLKRYILSRTGNPPHHEMGKFQEKIIITTSNQVMSTFLKCMKKYACFSGRATRSEYWIFHLWAIILCYSPLFFGLIMTAAGDAGQAIGIMFMVIAALLGFALFLPSLAVSVRRLHDIGESGAYLLMGLIPFVGYIILLVAFCKDSQMGKNQYGISEKYPEL